MDPNVIESKVMVSSCGHDGPMGAAGEGLAARSLSARAYAAWGSPRCMCLQGALSACTRPLHIARLPQA
jgi:ribulose 1,5-bisphosphate synthetase/thiazole synthase